VNYADLLMRYMKVGAIVGAIAGGCLGSFLHGPIGPYRFDREAWLWEVIGWGFGGLMFGVVGGIITSPRNEESRKPRLSSATTSTATKPEIVFIVEESPGGGLAARAVGVSIFSEAANLDELRANVREAVACHFNEGQGPQRICLRSVRGKIIPE